jgi:hypothetical protein
MSMDCSEFKNIYPELWNFLAAYFPDADIENMTDFEVVQSYSEVARIEEIRKVIDQGTEIVNHPDFPGEVISYEANRYFTDMNEARCWLKAILGKLKSCSNLKT